MESNQANKTGLLVCADLIFTTKIRNTAAELGYEIVTAQDEAAAERALERGCPRAVFVDLTAGAVSSASALRRYRELARDTCFVAFGPHVDDEALAAARAAGCEIVLPRSKFAAKLPELLRQCFERRFTPLPPRD
jgi:DNA-binding NarL/FixJ family response regulator